MKHIEACPICGSRTFTERLSTKDYTVTNEIFQIKACSNCTLLLTSPRPEDTDLGNYYLSENYISHAKGGKSLTDLIYLYARRITLRWKLDLVRQYSKGKTILDFGSGTGAFLKYLDSKGFAIAGVEPSSAARSIANGHFQEQKVFEHLSELNGTSHVITLWHVLEHLPNLKASLSELKTKLNDNGTIFLAVPNPNSWDSMNYESYWAGYDTPRHLWHFPKKSMQQLLKSVGLKLVHIEPMKLDAFYVSMLSEKYKNHGHLNLSGMKNAFINGLKSNKYGSQTGEYSSLIYIAKNEV